MDNTCATCQWFDPDAMACDSDDSGVYLTGPRGNCPHWEEGEPGDE